MKKTLNMFLAIALLVSSSFVGFTNTAYAATDIVNDPDLGTSLVSCWSLDEASGTRLDATASNNDLTDNNTVLSDTGKLDNAADFEKTNTEFLSINDNASLSLTGNISFSAWVRFETVDTSQKGFVAKWTTSTAQRAYQFFVQDNRLQVAISSTGSYQNQQWVSWTPTVSTWYHVAATYTASAGEVRFYVDGTQLGTTQTGAPTSVRDSTAALKVGGADAANYMDGLIDEVGVWSKVLTPTEISDLYNSGSGIPCVGGGETPARRILFI